MSQIVTICATIAGKILSFCQDCWYKPTSHPAEFPCSLTKSLTQEHQLNNPAAYPL